MRFPSAVIRSLLQVPQKWSDMDVIKLTWPWKPGTLKVWGEEGKKGSGGKRMGSWVPALTPNITDSPQEPCKREHPRPSDRALGWYEAHTWPRLWHEGRPMGSLPTLSLLGNKVARDMGPVGSKARAGHLAQQDEHPLY